jgi:hypothetical protein
MNKNAKNAKPAKVAKPSKSESDDFISDDAVSSGASRYMKLQQGENKIRFISKPITGWLEWIDKKPQRHPIDQEPEAADDENKPKKFLAAAIIDHEDGAVKILEVTQQSIIKALKALTSNPDWGNPFSYDVTIKKEGEDLKTKYTVTPSPKKPLSKDLVKAAQSTPCYLDALFEGEDPWDAEDNQTEYFLK